ncbi:MAG TPA: CBS domain-containing protein, partial [Dissulfurispiraceae bacterium]|nr:CBS domain-containing protein [Dissulfurispiraceae bacterium]
MIGTIKNNLDTQASKTVRDLLRDIFVSVSPDTSIVDALSLMQQNQLHAVAVTYDDAPVGIFSERNLVLAAHFRPDYRTLAMEHVMSSPAVSIVESAPAFDAFAAMVTHGVSHLSVVDYQGKCIGVISRRGMINVLGVSFFYQNATISDVMLRTLATAKRGELLSVSCSRMAENATPCIILEHERRPIGILTQRDLSVSLLREADMKSICIEDASTRPVITIAHTAALDEAVALMNTYNITKLVVVDQNGALAGLLTEDILFAALETKNLQAWKDLLLRTRRELVDQNRALYQRNLILEHMLTVTSDVAVIATDLYLKIRYLNEAAAMLLGVPDGDAMEKRLPDLFAQIGLEAVNLSRAIDSLQQRTRYSYATDLLTASMRKSLDCWMTGVRSDDNLLTGYIWAARDVTERRELEESLRQPLMQCKLTGLLNRRSLLSALHRIIDRSCRYGSPFSLVLLDIDRLKHINETCGYRAGDGLLQQIAALMEANTRCVDVVGRWSGGEFLIIAPESSQQEAS